MDRIRQQARNISRQPTRSNQSTPVRAEPSLQQALTLEEKKEIFLTQLKSTYKERYDAVQPIPYIKDRLYCVDKVFVEGSIEGFISTDESWERLESYNHIFTDPRIKSVRRIIEGEPGYGKSTLTLQLAYDWCNGVKESPFFDADVLILLRLRQLGNVKSIYRAIKMFLLPNEPRVKQSDIRAILEGCHSVKVLLDGYDEYPERDQTTESDVDQIVRLKKFRKFETTLTTRYLPKYFDKSVTKRVKLKGFDETARDQYIRKAITGDKDEKAFDKIKQGLKGNPILDDLCQVPLFFVTFAHMTHERKDFQKFKSVTEFFIYMMKCFHSHTRNKAAEPNVMTYEVEFESKHGELDKIAFEGLNRENQQIVWGKDAFCKRVGQAFYDHYIRVGILVEEKVVHIPDGEAPGKNTNTKIEVSFYHKLFCEWFASFRVADIAARVNNSAELKETMSNMDPLDLQYVFRFACGLERTAARNIIEYLRKKKDCDKFAILCILEQNGDIEEIRKTVTELCSKRVFIGIDDSKLLQRSIVQLLQIASSHDIPISDLRLEWSFSKVDNNTIILQSGIALPSLSSLEKLLVNAGRDKPELTEKDVVGLLNYVLPSKKFKTLWFTNCTPPESVRPEKIPEELKRMNVKVLWPSNARHLDLQSGRWKKADDVQSITELCSQTLVINNKDSELENKSAIELLEKASSHNIPIHGVTLAWSFSKIDEDGNIILSSGISLPILTSVENMCIQTEEGREMNTHEVNGILYYVQHSQRFKALSLRDCLLPLSIPVGPSLSTLQSRGVNVFWFPDSAKNDEYYKLDLDSGLWPAYILTFRDLKEELSSKLTQTNCEDLGRYFSLPPDQVQNIITSTLYSENFLLALEERGYINPSNVNRLTAALTELKINHTHSLTETYMKLRDQETEYDRFLAGLSAHLTISITVKLCDNFEVTDKNKKTVTSSQNPGLSFLQTIDEMGIINPSDVSKLKTPLEEYHLVQAVARIHEYQSLLSDETKPQDEGKENLFIKSLQQKMKSWFETMTPVPWKKSCQWKSNDLFIASGLVLTNSGTKVSSREVDRKCKLHYLDIFTDERLKSETRIILEGHPGSGKTMLSSQLAYDWCCGKLMDIPMVIYLPLKIVDNMTIIQAIKMFYIRKGIPITEKDIESMLNSDKKRVYLILDGLEEYNCVTKDGSLSEVMRVMTKEKLSNCIVIITARTDYIKHLPPGPMLTIGSFGEDERNEYIEKVYSEDLKKQEEVKKLIDNVPFILDICNVPLLFVLLVHNIDRLGKLQESQLDRVTPFVKAIVDILCFVQDEQDTSGHLSYQQQEYTSAKYVSISESVTSIDPQDTCITLEELAFNGLCKGNQQLFWHKDFVDRCVRNSKAWIDAGLLVVEEGTPFNSPSRDPQTDSGSESPQTDSISDESLNTSNVTSEIKRGLSLDPDLLGSLGDLQTVSGSESSQTDSISDESLNTSNVTSEKKKGVSLEPDLLESINHSKNKPILKSKEKKSEPLQKRKAAKYVSLQVKFLHKLIQEWFAAKYLALLLWGHKLTKHHYKYQLSREHLAYIDPADLHYVLRFTCHICPPSFHVIASFLMRDFRTGECEIPDYIMNCICLCFAEYDGYKGHKFKDIVKEVCRRESVNFSSEDSRLLLRSKVSMLTFASRSQIPINCLKLSDVVEKVTEKALILKADVSLGVLKTLRAIEVNRWDLKLIKQDFEHLIKFIINNKMLEVARLLFPSPPVAVKDEKDLNNLQSRNISVEWIIGANLIHTLNVTTGEWMMEFRLPGRMSTKSSSLKPISDNLPSSPLQMELWINKDGGVLELPDTGVSLEVPPGALEKDHLIQMRIIPYNFRGDSDLSFSSNSSVVVELLPSNLKLLKPAKLTLPHCLVLKKGCEWKAKIHSSHHEEGNHPLWEPQPDTPYLLNQGNCIIELRTFSWEKFDIGEEIVEGKRIVLYAAKHLPSHKAIVHIDIGYYLDLESCKENVSMNKVSVLQKKSTVLLKKGGLPLKFYFVKTEPPHWNFRPDEGNPKEIPFIRAATSNGSYCTFVFNKKGTMETDKCSCYFKAGQESDLAELTFVLEDGEEDSAANSSNKVVDAGLSQSQKRTRDESLTAKKPIENIDPEVRTECLRDISASSLSGNPAPSQSADVPHSKKRGFNESTAVVMDVSASSLSGIPVPSQSADVPHSKKRRYNESTAVVMDRVEDSAASSSDELVDAGLSQSQKKTCDESLTAKQPLQNIELEVRTESLRDLSGKIPKEWKNVGRNLGLTDSELCILERDNNKQGHKETVYQMLLTWKHRNGSKATYRVMGEALIVADRRDLQEMLYKQAGIKQES